MGGCQSKKPKNQKKITEVHPELNSSVTKKNTEAKEVEKTIKPEIVSPIAKIEEKKDDFKELIAKLKKSNEANFRNETFWKEV